MRTDHLFTSAAFAAVLAVAVPVHAQILGGGAQGGLGGTLGGTLGGGAGGMRGPMNDGVDRSTRGGGRGSVYGGAGGEWRYRLASRAGCDGERRCLRFRLRGCLDERLDSPLTAIATR